MDDAQPPTSAITYPAANATIPAPAFGGGCATPAADVCGTASDGADGSGVANVEVQLRRTTDGLSCDGSGWVADPVWIETAGTSSWTRAFPAASGYYTIASRATDGAGNVEAPAAARAFRILPATVDPVVVYTGDHSLVHGATVTLRGAHVAPVARLRSGGQAAGVLAGRQPDHGRRRGMAPTRSARPAPSRAAWPR